MRVLAVLALAALLLWGARSADAQGPNRAGLVIEYGDGRVERACVAFDEPQISGIELLSRSGLPLSYEMQGGGALVCSIAGEGCAFPAEQCLCQCGGIGGCTYWSYHRLQPDGSWGYTSIGASTTFVSDGEVDGWRWGAGNRSDAAPPPALTLAEICADGPSTPVAAGESASPDETSAVARFAPFALVLLAMAAAFLWTRRAGSQR